MITIAFVIRKIHSRIDGQRQKKTRCKTKRNEMKWKQKRIRLIFTWSEESAVVRVPVGFLWCDCCCCCCCSSSLPPSPMWRSAFDVPKLSSSFCLPPSSSGFLRLKSAILVVLSVGVRARACGCLFCFVFTHFYILLENVYFTVMWNRVNCDVSICLSL